MNTKERKQNYAKFIGKHMNLIVKIQAENLEFPKAHKTPNAKAIVELARTEIGFSCKTSGCDIFRSIMWAVKELPNKLGLKNTTPISHFHLEKDLVNKDLRLIMTDYNGEEWVLSHRTMCNDGGGMAFIENKKDSWYFKPKDY